MMAQCAPSPVRFAALAATVGYTSGLSPAVSKMLEKIIEKNPGAADKVVRLTEQLKVDFARYCEAFREGVRARHHSQHPTYACAAAAPATVAAGAAGAAMYTLLPPVEGEKELFSLSVPFKTSQAHNKIKNIQNRARSPQARPSNAKGAAPLLKRLAGYKDAH